jgi:xanthine/uracil permease
MIIDLDDKKNEIIVLAIFILMLILFIYSTANNFLYNFNIYRILCLSFIIFFYMGEKRDTNNKNKKIFKILAICSLLILSFFKFWINTPLLIFTIITSMYLILRHLNIIKFRRTDYETEDYRYF